MRHESLVDDRRRGGAPRPRVGAVRSLERDANTHLLPPSSLTLLPNLMCLPANRPRRALPCTTRARARRTAGASSVDIEARRGRVR